jgi:hypothetical protein
MKRWTHHLSIVLALGIALPAVAVQEQEEGPVAAAIVIDPAEITLQVGETFTPEPVVTDADGNVIEAPVIYYSMSRRLVGVNTASGEIEAYRPGMVQVIALVPRPGEAFSRRNAENLVRTTVTVNVPNPALASVELHALPANVYADTRFRLGATVTDVSGADRPDDTREYASSNTSVATVTASGTLSIHSAGATTLTVTANDEMSAETTINVQPNPTAALGISASRDMARTGDVVHFEVIARDADGNVVPDLPIQYAFQGRNSAYGLGDPGSGLITEDGRFVADLPGEYTIVAATGNHTTSMTIAVEQRDVKREIEVLGQGRVSDRATSDLWVWEGPDGRDYAMTGTHSADGHAYFWDVTDPGNMQIIDTIRVDARTVNDVKVSEDGTIAVISREGASNRRNGLVILDVSDLNNQGARVLARYDDQLTGGVHNVFVYQDHIYALSAGQRYDVINIEDPTNPHRVGAFELDTPGHSIHDVWVTDGIAYSSNWGDGMVAVDVGGGGQGGTPRNPVELGRTKYPNGWNHAAFPFRSNSTGKMYMIGGDEAGLRGGTPGYAGEPDRMQGWIHIYEWDEWDAPVEVARYEVPEAGTHNLWVDEENEVLYVGYYQGGLRVIDISGELLGDLYRQGREIAYFLPFDPEGFVPNAPFVWGPQPYKGNIFLADYNSGLWAVRLNPPLGDETADSQN